MKSRPRNSLAFLTVLAIALWLVPNAAAAVTSTEITSPSGPRFSIPAYETGEEMTVTGTAVGAAPSEAVDLRCYSSATESELVRASVVVNFDGSFEAIEVQVPVNSGCRLRAVPTGTEPTGSAAEEFSGPWLGVGGYETYEIGSGRNSGVIDGFYAKSQQLTAADDYEAAGGEHFESGGCGLADTYLSDGEGGNIETFFCNDYFEAEVTYGNDGSPTEPKESGFTVDGENAYFSNTAEWISYRGTNFPELQLNISQDPLTGDTTIEDDEPIVFCDEAYFPPEEERCQNFVDSGVRDHRVIEQTKDGHLVTITDEFVSTDGESHEIVALPNNEQNFGFHAETVEYEFPGESGYAHHSEGESVSFDSGSPAAVYMHVGGSADGDTETGRAAIVMYQSSSPAYFNNDTGEERNSFYFENQLTVPAGGSAALKYAYASGFEQEEVESLVDYAINGEPTPVTPEEEESSGGGSNHSDSSSGSSTSTSTATTVTTTKKSKAKFRVVKVKHNKATGTARVEVKVTGAGTVTLSCGRLQTVSRHFAKAGTFWLSMKPTTELEGLLRERGIVYVDVKFQFAGDKGGSRTHVKKMHLIYRG